MLVSDILKAKGNKVWTVSGQQAVRDALRMMVENKIGAVLVLDDRNKPAGVFSERDMMRVCNQNETTWGALKVEQVMSRNVMMCRPEDTIEYVMNLMTQQRIRHVPVAGEGKLCGIVTIGDIVKAQLNASQIQVQYLKDYLHGT